MGELYYEISLQGQEVVDLCKICTRYIPAKRVIRPGKTWQGRPVLVGSQGSAEGALPRLLESTGPFQGINNRVIYPFWQGCILFIPDLYSYIAE